MQPQTVGYFCTFLYVVNYKTNSITNVRHAPFHNNSCLQPHPTARHAVTPNMLGPSLTISDFRQTVMEGPPRHSGSYLGTINETRKTRLALLGDPRNGGRARGVLWLGGNFNTRPIVSRVRISCRRKPTCSRSALLRIPPISLYSPIVPRALRYAFLQAATLSIAIGTLRLSAAPDQPSHSQSLCEPHTRTSCRGW
jgi:hypothetical protein